MQIKKGNKDLETLHRIQTMMLKELDRVCIENNINYFIAYGTMLGQIRHGGFIPWDDDVDVCMMRKDYIKFLGIAEDCFDDKYFVQSYETDPETIWLYAKLRLKETEFRTYQDRKMENDGIYIDIFPLDFVPVNKKELSKKAKRVDLLTSLYTWKTNGVLNSRPKNGIDHLRQISKLFVYGLLRLVPRNFILNLYEKEIYRSDYGRKRVALLQEIRWGLCFSKKMIFPVKRGIFNGIEVNCVNNADLYLEHIYHDYMELPPEKERIGHLPEVLNFGKYENMENIY